jgi:hypothetical protein
MTHVGVLRTLRAARQGARDPTPAREGSGSRSPATNRSPFRLQPAAPAQHASACGRTRTSAHPGASGSCRIGESGRPPQRVRERRAAKQALDGQAGCPGTTSLIHMNQVPESRRSYALERGSPSFARAGLAAGSARLLRRGATPTSHSYERDQLARPLSAVIALSGSSTNKRDPEARVSGCVAAHRPVSLARLRDRRWAGRQAGVPMP